MICKENTISINKTGNVRLKWYLGAFTKLLLLWKSNKYYVFVCVCVCSRRWLHAHARMCRCGCKNPGICLRACSLTYPAWRAIAPYCLRPVWFYHIFRNYLIKGTICGKKNQICIVILSTTLIWNISHSKKNSARYYHKCENVFI